MGQRHVAELRVQRRRVARFMIMESSYFIGAVAHHATRDHAPGVPLRQPQHALRGRYELKPGTVGRIEPLGKGARSTRARPCLAREAAGLAIAVLVNGQK